MRTLESRILRKASVRFGEGRTEKCPQRQLAGHLLYSLVVRTVLRRHRELFIDYCRFRHLRWSTVTLAP